MGEVAVSNEEVVNLDAEEAEAENTLKKEDGSPSVVRWERFLPRRVLRVLLVEADDSTRQLITALLRKCSYRVAAVSDGLKAWEVLKGKPHHIDLILTEVDLPAISGFALLTLIMEHEICKNIPIIMMSSQDTVSLVYKCMMRGAADFLVKPVRINELKNLWQHVWRRQTSRRDNGSQGEGAAQQKVEATAENNAASNHSSGYITCLQTNRECIEKGSDAQSSCANPDLEAENAYPENMQYRSQPKWSKSSASDIKTQRQEECGVSSRKRMRHDCEDNGFEVASCKDANAMTGEDVAPEGQGEQNNIMSEACDNSHVLLNSSRAAIDLIGAFDDYTKCSYQSFSSDDGTNKVDSSPPLDLSLRRSPPCGSVNQVSNERRMLNHSDASAFSRYVNRAVQFLHSSASTSNQQKDYGTNSDRQLSSRTLHYNSDTQGLALSSPQNMLSLGTGQCGQAEVSFPWPQQKVFPVPVPVRSVMFDNLCTPYGSAVPPIFSMLSGLSTGQSHQEPLNAFHPSNLETRNSPRLDNTNNHTANNCTLQTEHKQRQNLDSLEDRRRFSSATDQSASSSFCNGTASHPNSIGFVSNANVDQVQAVRTAIESRNEGGLPIHDRNCNRSFQREAALTKFRLKRKERCFEKKVRYESRKKLAEERPRVKGQFVRHLPAEPALVETDSTCGNSLDS